MVRALEERVSNHARGLCRRNSPARPLARPAQAASDRTNNRTRLGRPSTMKMLYWSLGAIVAATLAASAGAASADTCTDLTSLKLPHVTITDAKVLPGSDAA